MVFEKTTTILEFPKHGQKINRKKQKKTGESEDKNLEFAISCNRRQIKTAGLSTVKSQVLIRFNNNKINFLSKGHST